VACYKRAGYEQYRARNRLVPVSFSNCPYLEQDIHTLSFDFVFRSFDPVSRSAITQTKMFDSAKPREYVSNTSKLDYVSKIGDLSSGSPTESVEERKRKRRELARVRNQARKRMKLWEDVKSLVKDDRQTDEDDKDNASDKDDASEYDDKDDDNVFDASDEDDDSVSDKDDDDYDKDGGVGASVAASVAARVLRAPNESNDEMEEMESPSNDETNETNEADEADEADETNETNETDSATDILKRIRIADDVIQLYKDGASFSGRGLGKLIDLSHARNTFDKMCKDAYTPLVTAISSPNYRKPEKQCGIILVAMAKTFPRELNRALNNKTDANYKAVRHLRKRALRCATKQEPLGSRELRETRGETSKYERARERHMMRSNVHKDDFVSRELRARWIHSLIAEGGKWREDGSDVDISTDVREHYFELLVLDIEVCIAPPFSIASIAPITSLATDCFVCSDPYKKEERECR